MPSRNWLLALIMGLPLMAYGVARFDVLSSQATNPATSGFLRIGTAESLAWRNAANSSNLLLNLDGSDHLQFNGVVIPTPSTGLFDDTGFAVYSHGDATKKFSLLVSGVTTGTTRTWTVPNSSDTFVGKATTDTLTNKTLTAPVIATIVNTGTLTLPTSTDTLVGKATTDILTNKTLTAPAISAPTFSGTITTGLTANRAAVMGGSGVLTAATTTDTEIGYVNGVTSAIQTQLNLKAPLASPTFTGNVGIPDGLVGTPGLAFSGDTDNGLYKIGVNDWGLSAGGVLGMELNNIGSSLVNVGLGVAANAGSTVPFTANRTTNAPVFYVWGNASTGTSSATVFQVQNGTGSNYTTMENYNGTTSGYMAGGSGFFGGVNQLFTVLGSEYSLSNIRFTVGGRTLATERMRLTTTDLNLNAGLALKFNGSSSGVVTVVPAAAAGTYTMTLPTAQGAAGQTMVNDGSGNLSWNTASGNGTGVVEYITNPNAESSTTGWAMYADAAGVSPVDGTGGSPATTIVRTTTAGEIIRQTASFKMAKSAANRQGEGVSYDFAVDPQDYKNGSPVFISFDYKATTNYAASDIKVFVYDKDAGALLTVFDNSSLSGALPASTNGTRFTGYFYPSTTTSVNYRLIYHIATTSALAYDFIYDTVHVGGANVVPGAIITEWTAYTPTGAWSTNTTYTGKWRRVGDSAEVQINLALAGAPTSATLTLNMPSGLVIDTNKLTNGTNGVEAFGQGSIITGSGGAAYGGQVWYSSTTAVLAKAINGSGNAVSVTQAVPGTFGNTDNLNYWFKVPIVGWASSAALSTSDALFKTPAPTTNSSGVKTSTASGNYDQHTNNSITLTAGTYLLTGSCFFSSTSSPAYTGVECGWYSANGADSASVPAVLNLATNLTILDSQNDNNFVNSSSVASQLIPAPTHTIKCTGSCTVFLDTFETFTTAANTRISVYPNAIKLPDFSIFSVYGNTEYQESKYGGPATNWTITASQYGDLTSLTLTPGEWDLTGMAMLFTNGAVTAAIWDLGITTTSGNSATGELNAENWAQGYVPATTTASYSLSIPSYRVTPTTTTTYYLKGRYNATITNLQYSGYRITARRIK